MIARILRYPHAVLVGTLFVIVIGAMSFSRLPADLLPTFETPAVQVVTFYPGMPPEEMERDIMSRLERWTGQSVGIDHQEGRAMLGVSIVKNFFREDVTLDTAMSQVTSYAVSDMYYLPPGTIPPMVMPFDPTASVPLALITVSSPTLTEKQLYDVAYFELRNRLQSIQGVVAPAVYGGKLRRILAYVDREKLEARDLSPMDVVDALGDQSPFVPAGNMQIGSSDFQIFANAMPKRVEDLNDIPIATRDGQLVHMRDVASVEDSSQIQSNVVRINGRRQVYIPIYRQPGANTIEIVNSMQTQLTQIRDRLREMNPDNQDLALEIVLDQSVVVKKSLSSLQLAAGLGAVLAGLIVFLFLRRVQVTLIVVIAIPLAILAALAILYTLGATLNTLTLAGIALAIGILVDQSIVVVENVVRHRRNGATAIEAAARGTREVAPSIIVSTVTFAVVFLPIVFLSGMARFLFEPLAVSSVAVIGCSLLVALIVVPVLCARWLGSTVEADEGPGPLVRGYSRVIAFALRARWLVVIVAFFLAGAAGLGLRETGSELIPRVDTGQMRIFVKLPSGTRIQQTEKVIAGIEGIIIDEVGEADPEYPDLENHPDSDLQMLISNIGVLMDWPAAYTPNTGPMDAFMLVQLKDRVDRVGIDDLVTRLRQRIHTEVPQADIAFDTGGVMTAALNFGEPAPIHFQIAGGDLHTLQELGRRAVRIVSEVPGATDVRIAQRMDYPTLNIDIDRDRALTAGVTVKEVMHNLVTATNSSINFRPAFWLDPNNGNHYFMGAQYRESALASTDTLLDIPITPSSGGEPVPLRTVADIDRGTGPSLVSHHNITRVVDIYAGVEQGATLGDVVLAMEEALGDDESLGLIPRENDRGEVTYEIRGEYESRGYELQSSGEIKIMREAFEQFGSGLLLAALLVYLVMVVQFRSFLDPLLVLLTVPLGLIGVTTLLFATGTTLNIQSFMGIMMMVGIVVEYGIVFMHFANEKLKEGATPTEAVHAAGEVRLKPILMTSLTTVLALLPMAIGFGGGAANLSLARAIVGGVIAATILTLVVLPVLYVIFKKGTTSRSSGMEAAGLETGYSSSQESTNA